MKTVSIPQQSTDVHPLLAQARHEDILLSAADGSEFILSAVDDFDHEIARTRKNKKLMAFLDERGQQDETVPLNAVKQQLGLGE
jgi:hypothetical protein